ncbi:MAG TPA: hypothetical protein VFX92_05010 [Candidatus Krumholzibacteria bacterium]|nr:hypothetical protein [Candidatus Krumholzibacteria bacterium]
MKTNMNHPWRTCFLLLAAALLAGCGGSGGDDVIVPPPGPPAPAVVDGVFDVAAHIIFDTCDSDSVYDGTYAFQIDDQTFTMGDTWSGTWNPKTASGYGESEHTGYTVRVCTVNRWTSLTLTFSSEDEFTGSITYHQRVEGDCQTPCVTTWAISGVREPDPVE